MRCDATEGPRPSAQPWPPMIEGPADEEQHRVARELQPMVDEARALEDEHPSKACDLYAEAARVGLSHGLRPFLPIRRLRGEWICPDVLMTYLPYAGRRYFAPETVDTSGRVGGGCNSFLHDKPIEGFREDHGMVWVQLYLVGVEWFRLGNYEEALNCFGLVPPEHDFANVAAECASVTRSFRSTRDAAGSPTP